MDAKIFSENQKYATLHLGAEVRADIADLFRRQCEQRHQLKHGALTAAIKLWVQLPSEIQARLLDQSLDNGGLVELVNKIVDERLNEVSAPAPTPRQRLHGAIEQIKEMTLVEREQPGTVVKVLDAEEQKALDDFIEQMKPEKQARRKGRKHA